MDYQVTIKEEPIDYIEDVKFDDNVLHSDIKVEYNDPFEEGPDIPFNIVEEGSGVITIKAVDLKTEDEANFLKQMNAVLKKTNFLEDKIMCQIFVNPETKVKEEPMDPDDDTTIKNFPCSFCHKIYSEKSTLMQHLFDDHQNKKTCMCPSCHTTYPTFAELSSHWKSTNNICNVSMENFLTSLIPTNSDVKESNTATPVVIKQEIENEISNINPTDESIITKISNNEKTMKYVPVVLPDKIEEFVLPIKNVQAPLLKIVQPATTTPTGSNQSVSASKISPKLQTKVNVLKIGPDIVKALENEERRVVLSKPILNVIENLPEKKALIRNIQEQIKIAESLCPDNEKILVNNSKITENEQMVIDAQQEELSKYPLVPPTFLMSMEIKYDLNLSQIRDKYPDYRFQWKCPKCQKLYENKYTFRSHLVNAHQLRNEEILGMVFKIQPSKREVVKEIIISDLIPSKIATQVSIVPKSPGSPIAKIAPIETEINQSNKRPKYKHSCPKCNRICSSKTMLNDHIKANCSREPQYPCTQCSKKFYSASTLNCHMTIHTGELPYNCSYCDKKFRTRGQVTVHHRTHTGERPFVCQICNQSFTHRETLISHLSRHIGMKRYKCYGCDKQFSSISGLKTHREIRPDSCGKVKFNSRALGPRVRVVQGNVIFEPQPEINPYLRTEDPQTALSEVQNRLKT